MQKSNATTLELEEFINVNLNCLEQRLDSKETVKNNLCEYIKSNFKTSALLFLLESLPIQILEIMLRESGMYLEIKDGKIVNIKSEEK